MVKVQLEVFDDRSTGVDSVQVLLRSGYPSSVDQKSSSDFVPSQSSWSVATSSSMSACKR